MIPAALAYYVGTLTSTASSANAINFSVGLQMEGQMFYHPFCSPVRAIWSKEIKAGIIIVCARK